MNIFVAETFHDGKLKIILAASGLAKERFKRRKRVGVADKKLDSRGRQLNVHKRAGRNGAPRI